MWIQQRHRSFLQKLLPALALLAVAAAYFAALPRTVQTGDSGELVASAYMFRVPHPSGYPLFVLLQHLFTRAIPLGTVFHRAAVLNTLFALGSLILLFLSGRRERILSIAVALALATSKAFWHYSLIPEVFSLNDLIASGILYLYLRRSNGDSLRTWGITLLFFTGLGNHLILIFLAPVVLHVWWGDPSRKRALLSAFSGALALALIYSSLAWMNAQSFYSWGELHSPSSIAAHFLRLDYSGNRPAYRPPARHATDGATIIREAPKSIEHPNARPTPRSSSLLMRFITVMEASVDTILHSIGSPESRHYFQLFASQTATDLAPFLLIPFIWIGARSLSSRLIVLMISFVAYIIVLFGQIRIPLGLHAEEVVERFHILPQLILSFAFVEALTGPARRRPSVVWLASLSAALMICASVNFLKYRPQLDFSSNTIVEDYAMNLLKMLPEDGSAVLLADDDTTYYALRYCQQIHGMRPRALVLSAPLLLHPWYVRKARAIESRFAFDSEKAERERAFTLEDDLIRPNLRNLGFYTAGRYPDSSLFRLTDLPLGTRIEAGAGRAVDSRSLSELVLHSDSRVVHTLLSQYDPYRDIFSRYSTIYLTRGKLEFEAGNRRGAAQDFAAAIKWVPYCLPALRNLCILTTNEVDAAQCAEQYSDLRSQVFDYY